MVPRWVPGGPGRSLSFLRAFFLKIILLVWKEGVVEHFGRLADSLRGLGHQAVLGLHPRSGGPVSYRGRVVIPKTLPRLLDRHAPDVVVLWNGELPMDVMVKDECRNRGIPILYCEMAWFPQSDTVYFDWEGVNGASSIRRETLVPIGSTRLRELDRFLARYHAAMAGDPAPRRLPRGFLLLPLQVESDSNILRFSPIKRMIEFVRTVRQFFPDEAILVRPHPKAPAMQAALPAGCCYTEPQMDLHRLLPRAKAVVALNSTVLLEALTHFKPVIAYGEGMFSGQGVACEASEATDAEMRKFVGEPLDAQRRARIAGFLYELIFHRTFYNRDLGNPAKVRSARFYSEMLRLPRAWGQAQGWLPVRKSDARDRTTRT